MDINDFFVKTTQALERIAEALERKPAVQFYKPSEKADPPVGNTDYSLMERDPLLLLCQERGIKVPSGTRTPTLVKMLDNWDQVQIAQGNGGVQSAPESAEPDPFTATVVEPEDPFAENAEPEKKLTRDDVLAKLQEIMAKVGMPKVVGLLKSAAGVAKFADVPDERLGDVFRGAQELEKASDLK